MSNPQSLTQSAHPEKPKMSRMAEFVFMLGGQRASWGMALAIVAPVVGHLQPVLGMPHLTIFAGLYAAKHIAKTQRRLAEAAGSLIGARTPEQEKNAPKAPYWAMVGHVKKQTKTSTGLLGTFLTLGITLVGGLWLSTKVKYKKTGEALAEASFSSATKQFQEKLLTGRDSATAGIQKMGGRGSEYYAWLNVNTLLSMSQPTAAAKLWERTRFDPRWGCASGENNKKLPFADALEAVLKKTDGHSAKAVLGGNGANGSGSMDTFLFGEDETDVALVEQIIGLARSTVEAREIRSGFKPQINQARLVSAASPSPDTEIQAKPHRAHRI